MTIYIILIGIAIASLIEPSNEFYTIINNGEKWEAVYHPLIFYILNLGNLFFIASFVLGVRDLNSLPAYLMEPRNKKINKILAFTFILAIVINTLFFLFDPIFGLISRFIVIFNVLLLAYYVANEPVMIFFDISHPKKNRLNQ